MTLDIWLDFQGISLPHIFSSRNFWSVPVRASIYSLAKFFLSQLGKMSATGSMGFHEPVAENTVILRPQSTIPNPTVVQALAALTAKIGCVSRRLEELLSSCQSDGEIDRLLWDDLEVLRRSADRYMNQYLDDLEQVHKQQVRHVYEVDNFDDDPPTGMSTAEERR